MEHGFRSLKAGKMPSKPCRAALRGRGGSAPPPAAQRIGFTSLCCLVVLFIYYSIHVALSSQHCSHPRGVLGANRFERKPRMKNLAVFEPLPAWYRVVAKKSGSRSDFRLTRSRHPSASGRRIGASAGDGWAARRDPETNVRVFYWAGLYSHGGYPRFPDLRPIGAPFPVPGRIGNRGFSRFQCDSGRIGNRGFPVQTSLVQKPAATFAEFLLSFMAKFNERTGS